MTRIKIQNAVLLSAFGIVTALHIPPVGERLVAEARIQEIGHGTHAIYLPVTLHGHAVMLTLGWGRVFGELLVLIDPATYANYRIALPGTFTYLGIPLGHTGQLDSLTVGTIVEHHIGLVSITQPQINKPTSPTGLPPVIGSIGNEFLAKYDEVVDGPARHVRLYVPIHASGPPALPPGVIWSVCTRTYTIGEDNPGFTIQADGHPLTGVMQGLENPIMNLAAAHVLGLTQHAPQVHLIPDSLKTSLDSVNQGRFQANGIDLTLGTIHFVQQPIHIYPDVPLETSHDSPTIELPLEAILGTTFLLSNSTSQICLGSSR